MMRNIRLLYLHNFLTDFRFYWAFIVIYFAEVTGSYTAAMAVLSISNLTSAVADIPAGIFSDRLGRKYTIAIGSACAALGIAFYSFASTTAVLFIGAVFLGLSECLFSGNNDALLYESLKQSGEEKKFHHYQGRISSMFQLALGLSALCAALLVTQGFRVVFIASIVPQILACVTSLFFIEPTVHLTEKQKSFSVLKLALIKVFRNPKLRLLMLAQAIEYGWGEAQFYFQPAYFNTLWPVWAQGIYKALNHAMGFMGFWFSGKIIDRIGAAKTLVMRSVYWFFSQTIGLLVSNASTPLIFLTGAAFFGPGRVAKDKLLQEDFSDQQRATMGSIASFMGSIFYALASLAIGQVADHIGLMQAVAFGLIMTMTALPLYIWLFRKDF